jgi:hypothetical protein
VRSDAYQVAASSGWIHSTSDWRRADGYARLDAGVEALETPYLALGTQAEIAEHLRTCRGRWGISYFMVRDLEGFAPVIERLRYLPTEPVGSRITIAVWRPREAA